MYAYQWWADTTTGLLKIRNSANSAWVTLFQLDGEWSTLPIENGTAAAPSIYFKDSGTDTGFYSPGADQIGISTGGTSRLVVDASGNVNIDSNTLYVDAANNRVGLGTSTFSYLANKLVIDKGSTANDGITIVGGSASNASIWFAKGTTGNEAYRGGIDYNFSTDKMQIYTGAQGGITIDSSNRLGIGTSSPGANLQITRASGDSLDIVRIGQSDGHYLGISRSNTTGAFSFQGSQTGNNNILLAPTSGSVGIGTTASNTNGGILQLSSGITFPATAVAASDANTLDDYEEGTWTPGVTAASGSITSYTSAANYTKIGRLVSLNIRVTITDIGTASSNLRISNLPFSVDRAIGSISAYGRESNTTGYSLSLEVFNSTSVLWQKYDGTFLGATSHIFIITIVHCT